MAGGSGGKTFSFSFFREAREELRKVTFPTLQQTWQATVVTLLIVVFVGIYLAVLDIVFNTLMGYLLE